MWCLDRRSGLLALGAAFALALDASAQKAYVTNASSHDVSVIDQATLTLVATVPVGLNPSGVAVGPDGARVFVANTGADSLSILGTGSDTVQATIAVGDGPTSVLASGTRAYTGGTNGLIAVVDLALGEQVATFTAGAPASGAVNGLALSPDGSKLYALWGNLVVLDATSGAILNSVYAGNWTMSLARSPDGARLYVPDAFGYGEFSFYGSIAVFDAATESVTSVIPTWSMPSSLAIAPQGGRAWLSTPSTFVNTGYGMGYLSSPWVAGVDLEQQSLSGGVNVGAPGAGVAISPDGTRVFVAVPTQNRVAVLDAATNALLTSVSVGTGPSGVAVAPLQGKKCRWLPPGARP